jgi:hypothetical protein
LILNTPPLSIEVRAQPIAAFDPHEPPRQLGQLEFRGGLALRPPRCEFGGLSTFGWQPMARITWEIRMSILTH